MTAEDNNQSAVKFFQQTYILNLKAADTLLINVSAAFCKNLA